MAERIERQGELPAESAGQRLDQALAGLFPEFSRSRLQQWLKAGRITVDGRSPKPRDAVRGGEQVRLDAELESAVQVEPEAIALNLVYEDEQLLVVDKPAGLVVHPGAGNPDGTLQNALLHHAPVLEAIPRCGIVHRIDKETSGLLVVARTLQAHAALVQQLQDKTVGREYDALVNGTFTAGGTIKARIDRHPKDRKRMTVVEQGGRPAVTHYRIAERFSAHTLLRVHLETGRTHQIRVHMAWIRHPLVGDPVYGGRPHLPKGADDTVRAALGGLRRQALHAARLTLVHPATGETMTWDSSRPDDLEQVLCVLRTHDQLGMV
ncbi:23S rRNA pseudouridine(1911/1915/1917) synthase RluD [Methylonatrum kenyense]|uniref:23S rRNA pseudouridine(1911/1915/1917) synthase RluD n=1 Tax=Methylonatrum kenyense TaxID=455253 RepID=UPI0020BDFEA4|nr:23S rRNA pseudouridine(1911/1915/1917) synthase RluD [Methylonatrum kenyense]MCK8517178.1 23S rRNA pseudouridine(1911/1915/1917) synthase RluD [Methylonatrum kenyense]